MKISTRFISIAASVVALATLTACVAPAPVYHTTRYPYQAPPQAVPYQEAAYVEYGHVANIEVLRSETAGTGTTGGGAQQRPQGGDDVVEHRLEVRVFHARAFRRLTITMPRPTPASASISCSVSGSPSSTTPNTSANSGVRKLNDDICVAG